MLLSRLCSSQLSRRNESFLLKTIGIGQRRLFVFPSYDQQLSDQVIERLKAEFAQGMMGKRGS
jgi:hypothetical protein|tara:strand:- start:3063 stop:3251 length:189 start_codon:yes stop_codon:yes gene_type:complete